MVFDAIKVFKQSFIKLFTDPFLFVLAIIYTVVLVVAGLWLFDSGIAFSTTNNIKSVNLPLTFIYLTFIFLFITFTEGVAFARIGSSNKVSIKKILRKALYRYPALLGTVLLSGVIISLGFLVFIIPGVFLAIKLSVAPVSSVLNGKDPFEAISESWTMTNGNWWRIFALFLLLIIVVGILDLLPYLSYFFAFVLIIAYALVFLELKAQKRQNIIANIKKVKA